MLIAPQCMAADFFDSNEGISNECVVHDDEIGEDR